ncbi:MAG: TatD family hydrolase, partial [Muribaculaceae bacterium]|nr:TatD family hydrolase [Muribaculaceae bacterium]
MIVDTHTHPYLDEYLPDKAESVARAIEAGIGMMVMPNVDLTTIEPMKTLHAAFPDNTIMAMGLHPTEIRDGWQTGLECIERELNSPTSSYHAVGEVGIDLYWDATFKREQQEALDAQFDWAESLNLPVIIHCRNGLNEVLDIIRG